jgi:alkanesulfonate monooxygenase SsuD/methylene tetrahydromethanopterin reductase-like flavin-dependent oxidoreductase (luciferase family)
MEEILTILPAAWSGQPFRHQGSVYDLPELAVRPVPSARIPVLVGGGAEVAVRRAARLADGIFANVPKDQLLQQLRWIEDECERVGRDPRELRIIHYSVMLPASSEEDAIERYTDHLWHMYWKYGDMEDSVARTGPPPPAPAFDHSKRDRLYGRSTAAGTPEQIVESLLGIREEANLPVEFAARSYFPTLEYDAQMELMHRLAEEVSPYV